jgi:hypothetical protein
MLVRSTRHTGVRSVAASCVAPEAAPALGSAAVGSRRLDGLGFNLLESGTFGSVVPGPRSTLYALQACGTEETELRVLHLSANGDVLAVSSSFERAALLTSSLAIDDGSLYLGAARLDLSGSPADAPYALTLYRLSAPGLEVLGSRSLGRGFGLSLLASDQGHAGSTVVASTGHMLLAVRSGTLTVTTLAGFGQSIAQHVSADTDAPYAAVSVFEPGSSRVSPGATVELIDTATGRVVSLARLAGALQVDSLAFGAGVLFAAVSDGMSTEVKRFGVPALVSPGWATGRTTGIPATLETMSLDGAAGVVWATDQTALVCLDASTGRVLSSATSSSSSAAVSGVVASGSGTYAVTSSGIGVLDVPAACGDGAA